MASLASDPARGLPRAAAGSAPAQGVFAAVLSLFALAVLVQVYLAGDAALIVPEAWPRHIAWVHVFQWIALALPPAGFWALRRWRFALLCGLPMAVLGLQYRLIHAAVDAGEPSLAGLHAVGGVAMFGLLVFIGQEWRHAPRR